MSPTKTLLAAFAFTAISCLTSATWANDGYAEYSLGGIAFVGKTDKVQMRRERLVISEKLITVDYEFVNKTDKQLTVPVIFPLPIGDGAGQSHEWDGSPPNFMVEVDGRRLPLETRLRAFESGRDVTAVVEAAGLTSSQISLGFLDGPETFSSKQVRTLKARGLLRVEKGALVPSWTAQLSYLWDLPLASSQTVLVHHEYSPFTSEGSGSPSTEEELRTDFCADDGLIRAWKRDYSKMGGIFWGYGRVVGYVLTTANSWAGPLEEFTMRVVKSHPKELVALCFPGKFKKIDALTFEVTLQNFVPTQELRIVFLNIEGADSLAATRSREGGPDR